MSKSSLKYYPELEGIRGYAFIMVFFTHYLVVQLTGTNHPWAYPFRVLADTSWVGVSMFFVLSGYLITGILLRSVDRNGYFRVFYGRRVLRVLPLYYLSLAIVFGWALFKHVDLHGMWAYLIYIQNLHVVPGVDRNLEFGWYRVSLAHLWSLAVEEQFYIVWPVVIFIFRGRRAMTVVCLVGIFIACLCRVFAPEMGLTPLTSYSATQTRFDALLLGALLAIYKSHPIYPYIERWAKWGLLASFSGLVAACVFTGTSMPMGLDLKFHDQWRVVWMIPLGNIVAFTSIIEVMRSRSVLHRVCSGSWICRAGMLTYGAYVVHYPVQHFLLYCVTPRLAQHMPHPLAVFLVTAGALGGTMVFATLSFNYLEMPFMRIKGKLEYRPAGTVLLCRRAPACCSIGLAAYTGCSGDVAQGR